ncbi:hypothetical protein T484DRAFT_1791518, partial [Baffinella frigidus]
MRLGLSSGPSVVALGACDDAWDPVSFAFRESHETVHLLRVSVDSIECQAFHAPQRDNAPPAAAPPAGAVPKPVPKPAPRTRFLSLDNILKPSMRDGGLGGLGGLGGGARSPMCSPGGTGGAGGAGGASGAKAGGAGGDHLGRACLASVALTGVTFVASTRREFLHSRTNKRGRVGQGGHVPSGTRKQPQAVSETQLNLASFSAWLSLLPSGDDAPHPDRNHDAGLRGGHDAGLGGAAGAGGAGGRGRANPPPLGPGILAGIVREQCEGSPLLAALDSGADILAFVRGDAVSAALTLMVATPAALTLVLVSANSVSVVVRHLSALTLVSATPVALTSLLVALSPLKVAIGAAAGSHLAPLVYLYSDLAADLSLQ